MDFRNLVTKYSLDAEKHLSGKCDMVLSDSVYDVWQTMRDINAEYDVRSPNYMRGIVNVLESVTNPGVHWHNFCWALLFALWHNLLALEENEELFNTGEATA